MHDYLLNSKLYIVLFNVIVVSICFTYSDHAGASDGLAVNQKTLVRISGMGEVNDFMIVFLISVYNMQLTRNVMNFVTYSK